MKFINRYRFLRNLLAILVLSISFGSVALAYQIEQLPEGSSNAKDFVVGPGKVEMTIQPDHTQTTEIKVSNRLGVTKQFHLSVEDFTGSNDPNLPVVLLGDVHGPYSLKDYISFPEPDFTLKSGERATVPVRISVPADAEPGGLYGSVLVSETSDPTVKEVGGGGSAIISRIGTLFFVTVPGEVKKEGQVTSFQTANKQKIFGSGPINFEILFENKSSIHLNPYGQIRITNMYGEEVGNIPIDPWFALPSSVRLREVSWPREFLFGKYTATAEINRGYDNIVDTKTFTFYVIPWKIALAVLAGLAIIISLVRFVLSRFEFKRKS